MIRSYVEIKNTKAYLSGYTLLIFHPMLFHCDYMSLKMIVPSFYNRMRRTSTNLGSGNILLNVGCGDGEYNRELSDNFEVTYGIDINRKEISYAAEMSENSYFILGNACEMPIPSNMFNRVSCIDVIEHIKDDESVVREISRVTKSGGMLVISVPHKNFPFTYDPINTFLRVFGRKVGIGIWGFGHMRLYNEQELSSMLERNGFKIEKIEYLNSYFSGLVENYISNVFYRFFKTKRRTVNRRQKKSPRIFVKMTETILDIDRRLFGESKTSIGIMIKARKVVS